MARNDQYQLTPQRARWLGLAFLLAGSYILALAMGWLAPAQTESGSRFPVPPPWWFMPAIALTFLGAGGSLLCYPRRGLVPTLCGLLAAACLSADLAWFALYSGVVQGEKRLLFLLPVLVCISAALAHLLQHLQGNTGKKANHPAADTPIEQARVYLAYGRRNEAQALIRKALSREPGNAELIAALQRLERGEDLGSR